MQDELKLKPDTGSQQAPNDAKADSETLELAQGYLANVGLSLSVTEEFVHADSDVWLSRVKSS